MMRVLHGCFACCSAQVTISLKSGSPPAVSVSTSSPSKVNTNDRVVLIGSARSSNPNPLNTSWSMVGTSTAFSLQVFGTTIASNAAVLVRPDDGCLTIYVCVRIACSQTVHHALSYCALWLRVTCASTAQERVGSWCVVHVPLHGSRLRWSVGIRGAGFADQRATDVWVCDCKPPIGHCTVNVVFVQRTAMD